jgi:hypothetical protein
MARLWLGLWIVLGSNALPHDAGAQDRYVQADDQLSRLAPSAFTKVPAAVIQALEAKKCTIPQASGDPAPHNVIRGSFAKPGQTDWAALCSRAKASAIVIIWGGESACADELEVREDRSYLQRVAGDKIVFTRRLAVISPDGIQRLYERYGGVTPPVSTRQGIEDITEGDGSVVRLCHEGRWVELTGRQN